MDVRRSRRGAPAGADEGGETARAEGGRGGAPAAVASGDLRWLGALSCVGSALVSVVGAVMLAGHLLAAGSADVVAGDGAPPSGYTVAAGREP